MTLSPTTATIAPFVRAGWSIHWLHPRTKRPIGDEWQNAPVRTLDALQATYSAGNNVGVRLGEPSKVEGGYLHVIDVDIRNAELAEEANARLRELFPDIDSFPSVISGSGGASRHYYFITDKPFQSRKLASSEGKFRRFDTARNKDVWSNDWEIELFGTGKQVVIPPSIHPDTDKPYIWEREFDFDVLEFGIGPFVSSETITAMGIAETTAYAFEDVPPLDFKPGQMEADLDLIDVSNLHYDDWIRLGQAIHHQLGGSQEGFDLWLQHTRRSAKFTGDKQVREMRRSKWRSFGKYRGKPVTMATVRQWAQEARTALSVAELDDLDDLESLNSTEDLSELDDLTELDEFDDLLGGSDADTDDFDAADAAAPKDDALEWKSLLEFNEQKAIKPTLHNVRLIVENDPRFADLPQFNEFTQEVVQRNAPGVRRSPRRDPAKPVLQLTGPIWRVSDIRNGDLWSAERDGAIRAIIEAPKTQGGYSLKVTTRDLTDAVNIVARKNLFHPVREWFETLRWDGEQRLERLFIDYLDASDTPYMRQTAMLTLLAAVARAFEPGHKADHVVIIEGPQGAGKSTFIKILAKHWAGSLEGDFSDIKRIIEKLQGVLIAELPELSGLARSDVLAAKAFLSSSEDTVRLAYERRAKVFKRSCILMGSTNDKEYLRDPTGNRRFWPIECRAHSIDTEKLKRNVDQLWAEAVVRYREMRDFQPYGDLPLYLADKGAAREALRLQEARRIETVEDATAAQIAEWLEKPAHNGSIDDTSDPEIRRFTCLKQLWCEALGNDRHNYNAVAAQMMGRAMNLVKGWQRAGDWKVIGNYGRGRYYRRVEAV